MYGGVGNQEPNRGALLTIDPNTGVGTFLSDEFIANGISGLDFTSTGRLFGSIVSGGGGTGAASLVEFNPITGAVIGGPLVIHDADSNIRIADLAVQPGTDVLYGIGNDTAGAFGKILYTIDVTTALVTLIGNTGLGYDGGLAFAPDGTLYLASSGGSDPFFHTLNPANGAVLTTVAITGATTNLDGLEVRPADSVIFGTRPGFFGGDLICTINPATGVTTAVGPTGVGTCSDLAFTTGPAPTPTPSATASPSASPSGTCPANVTINGQMATGDPTQVSRLFRDDPATTCAAGTTCALSGPATVRRDEYAFVNTAASTSCFTITLTQLGPDNTEGPFIQSAAYNGTFNPANQCANFLGDIGNSPLVSTGPKVYSVNVAAGAAFTVIVTDSFTAQPTVDYTLNITGTCGGATPTPTPEEATPTPAPEATPTPTPEATPTPTPEATPTPTPEHSPTPTPEHSPTPTPEHSPTPTPEHSPTPTPEATPTPTPEATPTPTPSFQGSFVIGDVNAVVGNHVTFWGAKWARLNSLSSGAPPPSSFKGFANSMIPDPAACGGKWTSDPGNSSGPPSSIPAFITAIAASSITKSGSTITGDIPAMVLIETDPGYEPNPGHPGTGTVVAVICHSAPLSNISTRLRVETADNVLIGGFIVTGTEAKKVLLRANGPSVPLADRLADPILELHDSSGQTIAINDNWMDAPNREEIIDTTIPPGNNLESAILMSLTPGGYTATVRGVNNTTGIGLVEAYDVDENVNSRLANISTRGLVQTGDNVLIAGMIVRGQTPQDVIVRAIGPSLNVLGKLANPTLELRDGNGVLLRSNDNWRSDQEAEIIGTTIPPTDDLESAIVATLPANGASYTAIVRGVNGTTGVAVVEVYKLQ